MGQVVSPCNSPISTLIANLIMNSIVKPLTQVRSEHSFPRPPVLSLYSCARRINRPCNSPHHIPRPSARSFGRLSPSLSSRSGRWTQVRFGMRRNMRENYRGATASGSSHGSCFFEAVCCWSVRAVVSA